MNRYNFSGNVKIKHRYTIQESQAHCKNMQKMLTNFIYTHYNGSLMRPSQMGYAEAEKLVMQFKTDEPQDLILAVSHYLDSLINESRLFYIIENPKLTFNGDGQFVCDMEVGKGYRRFQAVEEGDEQI